MKKLLIILSFMFTNLAISQTATLNGSNSSDPDGSITSYLWTKISGPFCTITSPTSAVTTVTGLTVGVYKFELKVTDNQGAIDRDTTQITVLAGNVAPSANAGPDQIITLPGTAMLNGGGAGNIVSYRWTKIMGPTATIVSPNSAQTQVKGLKVGKYVFRLTITDINGVVKTDDVTVTVNKMKTRMA